MEKDLENQMNNKAKIYFIIMIILTSILGVLTGLLIFLYHQTLWTLTVNFNYIFFVWVLAVSLFVGLIILILSGILLKKLYKCPKTMIMPPAFVIFFAVFSLTFAFIDKGVYNDYYTFSKEKWAIASYEERSVYVDSFLEMYDLNSFNEQSINEYLGSPDEKQTIELPTYPPQFGGYVYIYNLGFHRDYIDPSFFEITTSNTGNVSNYQIYST